MVTVGDPVASNKLPVQPVYSSAVYICLLRFQSCCITVVASAGVNACRTSTWGQMPSRNNEKNLGNAGGNDKQ